MPSNPNEDRNGSIRCIPRMSRVWRKAAACCAAISGIAYLAISLVTQRSRITVVHNCSAPWSSACFGRNRCMGPDGSQKLSIYVHDFDCTNSPSGEIMARKSPIAGKYRSTQIAAIKTFRELVQERGILAENAEDACIIVSVVSIEGRCVQYTSEWNMGRNHLLFDVGDKLRDYYVDLKNSAAMWAESNTQARYFRYGYDIAVPLPSKVTFDHLASVSPIHRKYFATFKGTLYLSNSGSEERDAIRQIGISANSSDVVVAEKCQELHKEHLLSENVELCGNLKREYTRRNYDDLMNTTFALIPAGRSPATFRLSEALSAGAIPVFFHDNFVKPFPDRIPWRLLSFSFSIEDTSVVIDTLRAVPEEKLLSMQARVLQEYKEYFKNGSMEGIINTVLDILEDRLAFQSERM